MIEISVTLRVNKILQHVRLIYCKSDNICQFCRARTNHPLNDNTRLAYIYSAFRLSARASKGILHISILHTKEKMALLVFGWKRLKVSKYGSTGDQYFSRWIHDCKL